MLVACRGDQDLLLCHHLITASAAMTTMILAANGCAAAARPSSWPTVVNGQLWTIR